MEKWPIGVFASVDAGLGVHFDVVQELEIPTVQIHAPHKQTRTPEVAQEFLERCNSAGIKLTCVFGGFDGESYADIPTTKQTVGLVPAETRAARVEEMKEISDFAKQTFFRVFKFLRCAGPIFVITPISGFNILDNCSISPLSLIPNSKILYLLLAGVLERDNGNPK